MMRVGETVDNQVRSLRKRQLIAAFDGGQKTGAYWGVRSDIRRYFPPEGPLPGALDCPFDRTMELAGTPTRLQEMSAERQHRLVNWGYAICDAAVRRHLGVPNAPVASFPFPGGV
jgi:NTE family protein